MEDDLRRLGFADGWEQCPIWWPRAAVAERMGEKDRFRFSQETLAAMDDAVTGRNLSGPYHTVKEAMAALDEEWPLGL